MKNYRKVVPWILVILWMALIFYMSHKPATESNKLSKGITEVIIDTVEKVDPDTNINKDYFNHILRKNAHFFTYLILGILVLNGRSSSGVIGYKDISFTLLICILYAISDEVHQLFVPGRGGQVKDVLIDSFGSIVGIVMYIFVYRLSNGLLIKGGFIKLNRDRDKGTGELVKSGHAGTKGQVNCPFVKFFQVHFLKCLLFWIIVLEIQFSIPLYPLKFYFYFLCRFVVKQQHLILLVFSYKILFPHH